LQYIGRAPILYSGDIWLHHMSSQDGEHVFHLHDYIVNLPTAREFEKFLLPHLAWKKITWTIPAYVWPATRTAYYDMDDVARVLVDVLVPDSCAEVVLEMELRDDLARKWWESCMGQVEKCRDVVLKRRNGEELVFDKELAVEYTWMGSGI
jgi:hypothetical protein